MVAAPLRYLLDTNVLSEPMRRAPHATVVQRLAASLDDCAIPAPVLHELEYGVARLPRSGRRETLTRYITEVVARVPILPYDAVAARWHARERARLEKRRTPAPFVDGQIAAIAAVHRLVVVTRNAGDFSSFEGIDVVDWSVP